MAINPYALCPCGSGKKIKFCCGDLAGEMEKVLRMVEGDQPAAAVRHLEQLLKKHPRRVSLLDLKAAIETRLGWYDQAEETIGETLTADPENANAWARRSALMSIKDELPQAVEALQRAISLSDDPPYLAVVLTAIRTVGRACADNGDIIAALAHFLLYSDVSPTEDLEGEREMIRLTRELPIPELLKGPFQLRRDGVDSELEEPFGRAVEMAGRGAWREAAGLMESLRERATNDAAIVYNVALLRGYLGELAEMASGLREYASREIPHDDAVEALAVAQSLQFAGATDRISLKEQFYEIEDAEDLAERLRQSDRAKAIDRLHAFWNSAGEGPAPQARFFVLDRPDPESWEGISLDDVPRVVASVELFGRETDRPPRAVVRITDDADYESKVATVRELLGVEDGSSATETDHPTLSAMASFSIAFAYAPASVSPRRRMDLMEESRVRAAYDVWPATPQSALGGSAPRDLAGDPDRRLELEAALLRLLETYVPVGLRKRVEPLFEELGVEPLPEHLDPADVPADRVTFVRLRRMDAEKMPDEQLAKLALLAALLDASRATAHLAREILHRAQLHTTVNLYTVCRAAIEEAADFESASGLLDDARRLVATELVPSGIWDVLEFEAALDFAVEERLSELFVQAAKSADANEDVARAFIRVLSERGLITRDGRLRVPTPAPQTAEPALAVPQSASEEPKIWTPESEAPQQGKGKIWTPS